MDPAKRIKWNEIYEHALIADKKNNVRQTYIGSLGSVFNVNQNK